MLSVHKTDGRTVLEVYGELDEFTTPLLGTALSEHAIPLDAPVTLDLTKCTFMLAVAISQLMKAKLARGDAFRVRVGEAGSVRRVFEVVGILGLASQEPHGDPLA